MKFKTLVYLILSIWIGALLTSCSSASAVKAQDSNPPKGLVRDSVAISMHAFLRGLDFESREKPSLALLFYQKALEFDPQSKYLHFRMVDEFIEIQAVDSAYAWAQRGIDIPGENRPEWLLVTAGMHRYYQNPQAAEALLIEALEQEPNSQQALYELIQIYEEQRDFSKLQGVLKRMVEQAGYPASLVEKFLLVTAINRDSEAQSDMLRTLWTETSDDDWGLQLAQSLMVAKKYDEASIVLKEISNRNPDNTELKVRMAILSQTMNQPVEAAKIFKSLYNPNTGDGVEYLTRAAGIKIDAGLLEEAYADLVEANSIDTTSALIPYFTSIYFSRKGDLTLAHQWVDTALSRDTVNTRFVQHKAFLHVEEKQYDKSRTLMDSIVAKFPDRDEVKIYYARLLNLTNDRNPLDSINNKSRNLKRIELLQSVFVSDSTNAEVEFELASALERLDLLDDAKYHFERLIAADSTNHQALNYWGYSLIDREIDVELGGKLVRLALMQQPENPAYLDSWAWYLYQTKDYQKSLNILLKVFETSSESMRQDPVLLQHIADCYIALGQKEKGLEFLKKAVYDSGAVPNAVAP